jgi:hypothetical protein
VSIVLRIMCPSLSTTPVGPHMFFHSPLPSEPHLISSFLPLLPSVPRQPQHLLFDTAHCTWQAIFKLISRPDLLWDCWGPRSLGAYPDIKSLWEAWDEGASVKGIGCAPAPRRIRVGMPRRPEDWKGKAACMAAPQKRKCECVVVPSLCLPIKLPITSSHPCSVAGLTTVVAVHGAHQAGRG